MIIATLVRRTSEVCGALAALDDEALLAPSSLPGWSRLTIACHLRYGATALLRMTDEALRGEPTAYYPEGRAQQRPGTLESEPAEAPSDVVRSLERAATDLCSRWRRTPDLWGTPVVEPPDNVDLGPMTLGDLVIAAMTEWEVHGTDLDLGLHDWSPDFVRVVLPRRLERLNTRRTNHRAFDASIERAWLLRASDGPAFLVRVSGERVEARPARETDVADATIDASARDIVALLLGRPFLGQVIASGASDVDEFQRALPGP